MNFQINKYIKNKNDGAHNKEIMSKGRLKSKTKILCLKNEKQLNKVNIMKIITQSFGWSEYCDFLYLVCVMCCRSYEKWMVLFFSLGLKHERALPYILFP